MADLQAFDSLLQATIKAPRLSGSKVTQLSEQAMKLVNEDHHIITTFFKLNNSLPPITQSRISSLYVFDAIARAARTAVVKAQGKGKGGHGQEVRTERGKGTHASLLTKMEGVVDSWVNGMVEDGKGGVWAEGKEKVRKIIDIWGKHGTFPQSCLDDLGRKLANAGGASAQADPSTGVTKLGEIGRQESGVGAQPGSVNGDGNGLGQGSTTPPLPPPAASHPRPQAPAPLQPGLPPEILKMLGIAAPPPLTGSQIGSPTAFTASGSTLTAGNGNATPIPPNIGAALGSIDIQALLASVGRAPLPPAVQSLAPAQAVHNGNQLSLPVPNQGPGLPSSAGVATGAPGAGNAGGKPNLNQTQLSALAKFAALAEAGPSKSHQQNQPNTQNRPGSASAAFPAAPIHHQRQNLHDPARGPPGVPAPKHMPMPMHDARSTSYLTHNQEFSHQQRDRRGSSDQRSPIRNATIGGHLGLPDPLTVEPMRAGGPGGVRGSSPVRRSGGRDDWDRREGQGGGMRERGHGHGSGSRSGQWGERTLDERGDQFHRVPAAAGRSNDERDNHDRSMPPFDAGSSTRGGVASGPPRDGHVGYGQRDRSRSPPYRDGAGGRYDGRGRGGGGGGGRGSRDGRRFDRGDANFTGENGYGRGSGGPTAGPPRSHVQIQGSSGRAPPPEWMKDDDNDDDDTAAKAKARASPMKNNVSQVKVQEKEEEGGEMDMALDDSGDEGGGGEIQSATAPLSMSGGGEQIPPHAHNQGSSFPQHQPQNQATPFAPHSQPQNAYNRNPSIPNTHAKTIGSPSLETFDMTTFDPSSPEAWGGLAAAWKVSMGGTEPDQMTLMNWVMMRMQG